jgi:hypothetical protein
MKHIKIYSLILFVSLLTESCKTEMIDQIDVFNLETGAYMRHVAPFPIPALTFSKASLSSGNLQFSLEAVDAQQGTLFTSYDLTARFIDRTPANGNKSVTNRAFLSLPASSFTPDPISKYPRGTMNIRAADLIRTLGLTEADVSATDQFEIDAVMKLSNGRSFSLATSDPDILGGLYYRSPFFYRVTVNP